MTEQQNEPTQQTLSDNTSVSWLDNLPEEIRKEPSLGKFRDIAALAQSYLEAEKSLNKRTIIAKETSYVI